MKTWMTTIGQKPFAAINTLWAALSEEKVGRIVKLLVLYSDDMKPHMLTFMKWAEILFSEYQDAQPKLEAIDFPAQDIKAFRKLLKQSVNKSNTKILMDITSGRKALSALMLLIGELFPGKVEKVYYSLLTDADYMNFPNPTIPLGVSQLYNLLEK